MDCATLSPSVVSDSATPRAVTDQAPLSMGLFRQGYWSGLPFPPPGDLPNPGIKPTSPVVSCIAGGFFTHLSHLGSPQQTDANPKDTFRRFSVRSLQMVQ